MNKGMRLALPLVVTLLCLQTALAQQSPAPAKRAPQLTDEDLRPATAPAPMLAEEDATARTAGGSRHQFGDLGLSFEFAGQPPTPTAIQLQMPKSPLFESDVKAQVFYGNGWSLMAVRFTSLSRPTVNDLTYFAAAFATGLGVSNPKCVPEPGANPGVRISGAVSRKDQTEDFKGRLITLDKTLWLINVECRQTSAPACADALRVLNSAKPAS
jgi:hypothetical protein